MTFFLSLTFAFFYSAENKQLQINFFFPLPATGKERGDIEIKDYVVMQKPQPQTTRLPPPHTLIMDYTMTHVRFGRSHLHPMVQLTNTILDGHPTNRATGQPIPPALITGHFLYFFELFFGG